MVDTKRLKGIIIENDLTQEKVAKYLNIAPKTFYTKMKNAKFGSDEMEKMVELLHIEDPNSVFFAKRVT